MRIGGLKTDSLHIAVRLLFVDYLTPVDFDCSSPISPQTSFHPRHIHRSTSHFLGLSS